MWCIYNGQIQPEAELEIALENRSFQYGDGLFETMIVEGGTIRLFNFHMDRLLQGLQVLKIEHDVTSNTLEEQIGRLTRKNGLENARVKLHIWRSVGGLFTPANNQAETLLTIKPFETTTHVIARAGFAKNSYVTKTPFSKFKSCNALPYVLAGLEKTKRNLDEIILLNNEGFVAECTSSNIFWIKEGVYYTPSLNIGCVDGVMRRHIIQTASSHQIGLHTGNYTKADLLEANSVFISNATGIYPILEIEDTKFEVPDLHLFNQLLRQPGTSN